MKRWWMILIGGVIVGLLAYGASYFAGSAPCRAMTKSPTPELAWLQKEFHLSNAEFARISKLHDAYLTACAERCSRIDAKNAELQTLLANTNKITPDIERAIHEAAQLRAECQKAMLQHFYEVSQTMPPGQGRRYLAWVIARTLGPEHNTMTLDSHAAAHERHD